MAEILLGSCVGIVGYCEGSEEEDKRKPWRLRCFSDKEIR